ncbi:MAG: BPL-N domain-containing protein [Desulfonatronovibrio sp.]
MNKLNLLWDESHFWGIMLVRALQDLEIPFKTISADQVKAGILEHNPPAGLLVPGGWARLKADILGRSGLDNIRKYVSSGGKYLGFCGGAGLALRSTSGRPGLELSPWGRKPVQERLPNFSGHILCRVKKEPLSYEQQVYLPAWWPSQFKPCRDSPKSLRVMARYLSPGSDFWSSDLKLSQIQAEDLQKWENIYKINLDPAYLEDEPCIIQDSFGLGEYILSYVHLETPQSPQANRLLWTILRGWLKKSASESAGVRVTAWNLRETTPVWKDEALLQAKTGLDEIIDLGQSQFLLFWRTSWLLGWRRGIPGSPVNFLYAMICRALTGNPDEEARRLWNAGKKEFQKNMETFLEELKIYLSQERLAIAISQSSPESSSSPDLQNRKQRLFGTFPGYGGIYGQLIRQLDQIVFRLL